MGMAQHRHNARSRSPRQAPQPAELVELPLGFPQQVQGIGGLQGLQFDAAVQQGALVVERTAQPQFQMQRFSLPPAGRQLPAATGVEQVSAVDPIAIDPELGLIGPPAQHQTGPGRLGPGPGGPGIGAVQPQPEMAPLSPAGPDDQTSLRPVWAVTGTPGIVQSPDERTLAARLPLPAWLKIQPV